jgi:hypothetical protein
MPYVTTPLRKQAHKQAKRFCPTIIIYYITDAFEMLLLTLPKQSRDVKVFKKYIQQESKD